ncbi:ABC transporter substrate-binding protein [Paraglaciecola aquimarina]|uniref:ABC transporter substrate-binding protein n=2 Tax=Paraglaciecola aquimarina TaxID=1235557 RepID=A0ABU3T029_9ALTE|nr:ABC transporter substrate-binding protein [Paraglaciecola aquimarina]MDU0355608.1 ABC transporter substrate-binding protein [Paraglaciecola aquimarina]
MLCGCDELTASYTDPNSLIYCSEGSPANFNPQLDTSGTTVDASSHQIYDRLLDFDPVTGDVVPALATSWSVSKDGKTYTFQLRKGVSFHQTKTFTPKRKFNADDVLFSFNRWRLKDHAYNRVSGGKYPYTDSLGLDKLIKDIKRLNGYRVEITLHNRESSFLANLATDFAVILSAEYADVLISRNQKELIDQQPVGTGPYKLLSFHQDRYIKYNMHPDYWRDIDLVDKLIFDITPSSSLRLAKLLTSECDAIALPAHSELEVILQQKQLELDERPGLNVGFWAFNTSKPPFDNPQVRKALALAIDRNALIEAIYFNTAIPAKNIVPPTSWAYQSEIKSLAFNPITARKILREQGIEEGFTMTVWAMPVERTYNPNALKMAELIRAYLQQVGITVNIVSFEWSIFREYLTQGLHDSVLIGWSADNGDPDNFYRPLLSCDAIQSGTNRAMWCSAEYDKFINQALQYADIPDRAYFYGKANEFLAKEMPLIPIAHASQYQAYNKNVAGLVINPYGGIRFGGVKKLK